MTQLSKDFSFELVCALSDIGRHAKEHNLTPEQVRLCFRVGSVAATQFGILPPQLDNINNFVLDTSLASGIKLEHEQAGQPE